MLKFIPKVLLFLLLVLAVDYTMVAMLSKWPYYKNKPDPHCSISKLVVMPADKQFDLVFLGASHGECLTVGRNFDSVSAILNRSFINLAKGQGSGIIPMAMFTDYFYHYHNTGRHFIYFIDSQCLFTEVLNEKPVFLRTEPFDLYLLLLGVKHHITEGTLVDYFQTKFGAYWLHRIRKEEVTKEAIVKDSVNVIDPINVKKRIDNMFFDGLDTVNMLHYKALLLNLVRRINAEGEDVTFVIPPTLLGVLPGDIYLQETLKEWNEKYQIRYIDLSQKITDPSCYYNLDHLNTKGADLMMRNYIKPIVDTMNFKNLQSPLPTVH